MIYKLSIFFLFSFSIFSKVTIYQQWHLGAKTNSLKIEESKKLPQYTNQKFIFNHLDNLIKKGEVQTLISEGCEGEINSSFKSTYNGWNYQNLKSHLKNQYDSIMTLIPLKLEVKYTDKLKTICGDNQKLIDQHGLAFSDLRGFYGYYLRFLQYRDNKAKRDIYLKALEETEEKKINDPITYTREKGLKNLANVKHLLVKRNEHFLKNIIRYKDQKPALVIGALHLDDLVLKLKKEKIDYVIVDVEGLPKDSKKLLEKLEAGLK